MAAGLPKMNKQTLCEAQNEGLFNYLPPEEQAQLHTLMQHRLYDKGETIFSQGDIISGCWVLCQGKVQLIHLTTDGCKQTVELLKDGDCFGEDGFCASQRKQRLCSGIGRVCDRLAKSCRHARSSEAFSGPSD
ncbi:MAG: cyclic nucleotide-binding domain-containing protein [Candidatus Bipolaricaulia bacterium]